MKRRRLKLLFTVISVSLLAYAKWIEPNWIEVTEHRISAKIDRPLKIVLLADLHTHEFRVREEKVLDILRRESPDAIVISGDTIANEGDWQSVEVLLARIHAPLGVFLVRGNWEHWSPNPNELKIYRDAGVIFLNNSSHQLSKQTWIVGIDDSLAGNPDAKSAFEKVPADAFRIVLFHSPAYLDSIDSRVDLGLAGHTHGGQVRIPFLPPIWLPEGSGRYVAGWYTRGANRMYVSRGVGNSILELRFACRPEVSVFYVEPEKQQQL